MESYNLTYAFGLILRIFYRDFCYNSVWWGLLRSIPGSSIIHSMDTFLKHCNPPPLFKSKCLVCKNILKYIAYLIRDVSHQPNQTKLSARHTNKIPKECRWMRLQEIGFYPRDNWVIYARYKRGTSQSSQQVWQGRSFTGLAALTSFTCFYIHRSTNSVSWWKTQKNYQIARCVFFY